MQEEAPTLPEGEVSISQEEAQNLLECGLSQEQDIAIDEA